MSGNEARYVRRRLTISRLKGVFGTWDPWIWALRASSKLGLANTLVHGCDLSVCVFGGLLVMTDWWAGFVNSTDWVITRKCSEQALIGPRLRNFGSHWLMKASWMILLREVVIRVTRAASNTWSSVKWHACAHMYFGIVDCQDCCNCCSAMMWCLQECAHILGRLKHKQDDSSTRMFLLWLWPGLSQQLLSISVGLVG